MRRTRGQAAFFMAIVQRNSEKFKSDDSGEKEFLSFSVPHLIIKIKCVSFCYNQPLVK